jgi:hypothetical protein
MLNAELVFGLVSVGFLYTFSLWENPPQWRMPRLTKGGIFHRQAAALWVRVVHAAAWWHCFIGGVSVELSHYPTKLLWPRWSNLSGKVDNGLSALIRFLLLDWIAWPIAKEYLQDKWQAENEEANRKWLEDRQP